MATTRLRNRLTAAVALGLLVFFRPTPAVASQLTFDALYLANGTQVAVSRTGGANSSDILSGSGFLYGLDASPFHRLTNAYASYGAHAQFGDIGATAIATAGYDSNGYTGLAYSAVSVLSIDSLYALGATNGAPGYIGLQVELFGREVAAHFNGDQPITEMDFDIAGSLTIIANASWSSIDNSYYRYIPNSPPIYTHQLILPLFTTAYLPVVVGQSATLRETLNVSAQCFGVVNTCSAVADFGGSAHVGGAAFYDSNFNLMNGVTITSESGYDYTQPVPDINSVPEPASVVLLGGGLLLLGLRRRRS